MCRSRGAQSTKAPGRQDQRAQCAHDRGDHAPRAHVARCLEAIVGIDESGSLDIVIPFDDQGYIIRALEPGRVLLCVERLHAG